MSELKDITDRLIELDHEAHSLVDKITLLKTAYGLGYRKIDENDELHTGGENVVNIHEGMKG